MGKSRTLLFILILYKSTWFNLKREAKLHPDPPYVQAKLNHTTWKKNKHHMSKLCPSRTYREAKIHHLSKLDYIETWREANIHDVWKLRFIKTWIDQRHYFLFLYYIKARDLVLRKKQSSIQIHHMFNLDQRHYFLFLNYIKARDLVLREK